jgi:hypothetical protein
MLHKRPVNNAGPAATRSWKQGQGLPEQRRTVEYTMSTRMVMTMAPTPNETKYSTPTTSCIPSQCTKFFTSFAELWAYLTSMKDNTGFYVT